MCGMLHLTADTTSWDLWRLTSEDKRASNHDCQAKYASGADGAAGVLVEELLDGACPLLHLSRRLFARLLRRLLRLLRWLRGPAGKLRGTWQMDKSIESIELHCPRLAPCAELSLSHAPQRLPTGIV
jgi:hypothetical protein